MPQTFFHVSKKDLGEKIILKPKVPGNTFIMEEGNLPRICVTPTIYHCLNALVGYHELRILDIFTSCRKNNEGFMSLVIYSRNNKKLPYLAPERKDFRKNFEHWYLEPVEFKRMGYLDLKAVCKGKIKICNSPNIISYEDAIKVTPRNLYYNFYRDNHEIVIEQTANFRAEIEQMKKYYRDICSENRSNASKELYPDD